MIKRTYSAAVFLWLFQIIIFSNLAKAADESKPDTKPETVDDLITNNNLRAYSGSTSLLSIASQFNYNGGTLLSAFSQDRPDISGASGTTTKADLDGSISLKYNFDLKNSLMLGFGVRWIAPLTPGGPTDYPGKVFDAMNPYLQYQYVYKWFGIQSVLQVEFMQWTQTDQTAYGYNQQLGIDQENMYEIGKTGLSVGVSALVQEQWFNKSGAYSVPSDANNYIPDLRSVQSQYMISFSPELEYQLTEKINLRTLIGMFIYEHYLSQTANRWVRDTVYQSIGVGFSITRDIFLYPNVQFLPSHAELALTNVGLTATINLSN